MTYKSKIGKLDFKRREIMYNNEIGYFVHNINNKLMDKITKEQFDSLDLPEQKLSNK